MLKKFFSSYNFPILLSLSLILLYLIWNITDIFEVIYCSDDSSNNNNEGKVNITGNLSVTLTEAVKAGGIGYGAAKMIQACPPQSRLAATLGLGTAIAATTLLSNAIDKINKDNKNVNNHNNNDDGSISSIFEPEFLNDLNPEQLILYSCFIFICLAIYFFIGLLINIGIRNYFYMPLKIDKLLENSKIINYIFSWFKSSNKYLILIIYLLILYSLIASLIGIGFLISNYDKLHKPF